MDKVSVCTQDASKLKVLRKALEDKGLKYVEKNPDVVISLGGDGTFLFCERDYPGVPKLLIRDSKVCVKCIGENDETILDFIKMDALTIEENFKLEASFDGHKLVAVNDVIIRNKAPNQALRFAVYVDGEKSHEEVIGDGVVIATPFGSTGYFKSITRESFGEGIGVAFSNPVKENDPLILNENKKVIVRLLRGDALLAADNNPRIFNVKEGDSIAVMKSEEKARIIMLEGIE